MLTKSGRKNCFWNAPGENSIAAFTVKLNVTSWIFYFDLITWVSEQRWWGVWRINQKQTWVLLAFMMSSCDHSLLDTWTSEKWRETAHEYSLLTLQAACDCIIVWQTWHKLLLKLLTATFWCVDYKNKLIIINFSVLTTFHHHFNWRSAALCVDRQVNRSLRGHVTIITLELHVKKLIYLPLGKIKPVVMTQPRKSRHHGNSSATCSCHGN